MTAHHILDNTPLLRIVLPFATGIVAADGLTPQASPWLWVALAVAAMATALLPFRHHAAAQGASIMVATLCLGGALALRALQLAAPHPSAGPLSYEAIVVSTPEERGKTVRCDLIITRLQGHRPTHTLRLKAHLLKDPQGQRWRQLQPGDGLTAHAQLEAPQPYRAGSRFDYARWMQVHGFAAQTFVHHSHWQQSTANIKLLPLAERIRLRALQLRASMLAQCRRLGLGHDQYAVVAAMALGDKSSLSRELKERYAVAGTSHVLALSGLHVGIIYALLTLLGSGLRRRRWLVQGAVLAAIWAYVVVVGLPPSAIRAATMLSVCTLCALLGRQQVSVNTLALAALAILAVHPLSLWDVGFQLSFAAVLAIMVYFPTLYHLLPLHNPIARWLWGLAAVSIAAQVGTAPLVAHYFGRLPCYALPANILVVPMATLLLYAAAALLVATPIPALQQLIATAIDSLARWLNTALTHLAQLPGASIEGITIGTAQLYLIYIVLLSLTVLGHYALKTQRQRRLDAFY